ncbi:MAG: choice-of-anchor J domain-containing protein [Candidatus Cloacimonas sp.]|nr:choice-of-anchor J domain-containing protein [Candidatus Cloacimonas sp.]
MLKNSLPLVVVLLFIATICDARTMPATTMQEALPSLVGQCYISSREVPPYSFSAQPTNLLTSYWDYMIGGFNGLPLCTVPDNQGGGYFLTYSGKRSANAQRRVFYAYLNNSGQLINNNEITEISNYEGYSSLAVDPVSGKPLYAWHLNADTDAEYEVQFTSDAFISQIAGLFNDKVVVINNPTSITPPNGSTSTNSEFIWPTNVIGPSPIPGKRRIYVAARNSMSNAGYPVENVLIAYADFNGNDLEDGNYLVWNYTSIPELNAWNHDTSIWRRPFHAFTADASGNLYLFGYHTAAQNNVNVAEADMDIFICSNYGMGTWRRVSVSSHLPSWNPNNYFTNSNGIPYTDDQLFWGITNSGHLNASVDNAGNVQISGIWALMNSEGAFYPRFQTIKNAVFYTANEELQIRDVNPQTGNPNGNYQPWDLVLPWGAVDAVDANGDPVMNTIYPYPYYDADEHSSNMQFHYNNVKISKANEEDMMVCVWQDSERARRANIEQDPAYAAYINTPEICISVSPDNGDSWSQPIVINNIETPAFNGIKPMWVYPADKVKYIGMQDERKLGKIGLIFYNDNTWGANSISPPAHPANDGGSVMFMELQVLFPLPTADNYVLDPFEDPAILAETMQIGASATINGNMAALGDIVAAFVDVEGVPQLRGKGQIQVNGGLATCNFTVYTSASGESIHFELWDYSAQTLYNCNQTLPSQAGGWIGTLPGDPYHLNFGATPAQVSTPEISVHSGTYFSPQTVQISCSTPNAQIRYSLDGTIPTASSTLYSSSITISESLTLNAKAFLSGWLESSVAAASYVIAEVMYPPTDLSATVTAHNVLLDWNSTEDFSLYESFEQYEDFVIQFPPWVLLDVDGSFTYIVPEIDSPDLSCPKAYMIFNPSATIPPTTSVSAHTGNKFAACIAAAFATNNDWLISEPLALNGAASSVSFWAKSHSDIYGLERFKVGISLGGVQASDFTIISGTNYVQAPVNWTQYTYDLSAYEGENIRFAIQCVSDDAFIFCVDDIVLQHGSKENSSAKQQRNSVNQKSNSAANLLPVVKPGDTSRELLGYKVYRNSVLLGETTTTAYPDSDVPNGTYTYSVTALYTNGESVPATTTVAVNAYQGPVFWQDCFEEYDDFALDFGAWSLYDLDASETYSIAGTIFPHDYDPMAFIIFNPSATTPPMLDTFAYSGAKMAACIDATNMPNNDWLISPYVDLGTNSGVTFFARSHTAQYGLERIRVAVTTDSLSMPPEVVYISGDTYVEVPATWSQFSYDLSAFNGQRVRIAIQCVSDDAFILWLDDFAFVGLGGNIVALEDNTSAPQLTKLYRNYPNPFNPETTIRYSIAEPAQVLVEVFNMKGQRVRTLVNEHKMMGEYYAVWNGKDDRGASVSSGVYYYKLSSGRFCATQKMILMK